MSKIVSPQPLLEEIVLDPNKTIMSKTNKKGVIEYANEYFMEVCGYEEFELIGQPHNIIRHPDMPKVIFKLMWEKLLNKENIHAVVKNLAKDGRFYWVITDFEVRTNEEGEITALFARRKAAPRSTIAAVENLYRKLVTIEEAKNVEVSQKYFEGFLEEKGMTYNEYIENICNIPKPKVDGPSNVHIKENTSGSFFKRMFG